MQYAPAVGNQPFRPTVKNEILFYAGFDESVKSQKFRHSCEIRSPELLKNTGFRLLPE